MKVYLLYNTLDYNCDLFFMYLLLNKRMDQMYVKKKVF